jgi:acyl-CoA hydrolase
LDKLRRVSFPRHGRDDRVADVRTLDIDELVTILARLPENPRAVISGNYATPEILVGAIDRAVERYRLYAINAQPGLPDREGVTYETSFVGVGMRRHPRMDYTPSRLSLVPWLFSATLPPDVVLLNTTPVYGGKVSLGIEVNILPGAIEAARARGALVVAQLNPRMPYTFGDAEVPVELIDYAVEVDHPLREHASSPLDEQSRAIGKQVSERIQDGATMQLGIGAVPDAVLHSLRKHRRIGLWTEMFSDGLLTLDASGALDPDRPITASFLFGSRDLYSWVDHNPRVRMLRTETSNDPGLIAKNPLMTSVNTALQIDLFGQANASRINTRIFSGFGGQTDFYVGALHAPGGQAFLALRSWHRKADVSTVVPLVDEPVTSFQMTTVVTEQGAAEIFGCSERQQAANLIENAAHPRVREELWEEASALGLA